MEIIHFCGNVAASGAAIHSAATGLLALGVVPPESAANQSRRDRGRFHMTLVTKDEMRGKSEDDVMALFEKWVAHPAVCLGLGQAGHAMYCIMYWPHGNAVRASIGLHPKDFHVTLGFGPDGDVHGVPKGPSTLAVLTRGPVAVPCVNDVAMLGIQLAATDPHTAFPIISAAICYGGPLLAKLYHARCFLAKTVTSLTELDDASAIVAMEPTSPAGYVRVGDAFHRAHDVQGCTIAYWTALFVTTTTTTTPTTEYCLNALAGLLLRHPHDLVLRPGECFGPFFNGTVPPPYACLSGAGAMAQLHRTEQAFYPSVLTRYYSLRGDGVVADMEESTERRTVIRWCAAATHAMPRFLSWVVPGFLCGMSTPRNGEDVAALRDALGITVVVTATKEEPLKKEWFTGTIRNAFIPVDNYFPPNVEMADAFLGICEAEYASGGRVLMHCGGGKGRAGSFMCAYLMRFGVNPPVVGKTREPAMGPTDAMALLRAARPGSIETAKQEEFVHAYAGVLWRRCGEEPEIPDDDMTSDRMTVANHGKGVVCAIVPTLVFCMGLPGSGKSFFSQKLAESAHFTRVSQDDLDGSRRDTEDAFSHAAKRSSHSIVLDRCNPTVADRKAFLELAFRPDPAKTVCVHFAAPPHTCLRRANRRFDHPTIEIGRADRAVEHFVNVLEAPTCAEGFGQVITVFTFADVAKLLARWGVR